MKIQSLHSNTILAILSVVLLLSCSKQNIDINTPPPSLAAINFIQSSPDSQPVNFYVSSFKVNIYPFQYNQISGYLNINAGADTLKFQDNSSKQLLLSKNFNFAVNTYYSVFFTNKPGQQELFILTDTLNKPAVNTASIRFINVSPDALAVDLVIKGGSTLVANKGYKGFSSFSPIQGDSNYNLEIHKAGTGIVLATLNNFKLQSNYVYTIWLHGLVSNTSSADQLTLEVMTNTFYL